MVYRCELGTGQHLYLENQGMQTIVALVSSSVGQQQQASSSFSTGVWTAPPNVFHTTGGYVVQIKTDQGERYIQVQGNSVRAANNMGGISDAQSCPIEEVEPASAPSMQPMAPMQSMQPMQPMKMGDMQMSMNPMEMRMGNMELRMEGSAAKAPSKASSTRRFCSQCGASVDVGDRFCASCGHSLKSEN